MSAFSPQSPPTPAMFGLDSQFLFQPQPGLADWSMQLDAGPADGSGLGQIVQGTDDVQQCLLIVSGTPKGSDPLRPTFGADLYKQVDPNLGRAIPNLVREESAAIETWEKRAKFDSLTAQPIDPSDQSGGHLILTLLWRPALPAPSTSSLPPLVLSFPIGGA